MTTKFRTQILFCGALITASACAEEANFAQLEAKMTIEPANIDFGDVQIGTTAKLRATIRNTGNGVLNIRTIDEGTPFDEAFGFEVSSDRNLSIGPGSFAEVTLSFHPTQLGESNGILHVTPANLGIDAVAISITGQGVTPTLEVEPQVVSFGSVVIDTSKTIDVSVTNTSSIDAEVLYVPGNNIELCGSPLAGPSTFCLSQSVFTGDRRFALAPGQSATLRMTFEPSIAGTRESGRFTLRSCDDATCDVEVKLDGVGIESGFRCQPPALDFEQVNPGSCLTKSVRCENIANEQVAILDWKTATEPGSAPTTAYSLEPFTEIVVLAEGETVVVDATFCPVDLGNAQSLLLIETDNPDPRRKFVTIPMSGTGGGPDIEVQPPQLNFGQVSLIAPSRRTVSVQNVGFDPLEISEVVVDVMGTGAFAAPGASATLVPVGGFFDITVEFQPRVEGPVSSQLIIRSNDQDEPEVIIDLLGEGINLPPCSFDVRPASLAFGVVERGRSVSRAFEIHNTGTSECLLTSVRMLAGGDVDFSLPDGDIRSLVIPPGAATTIRAQYAPASVGTHSAQVEFSISSPTQPFNTVEMTGTGADASLLITPNDLDFGVIGVNCAARARTVTIYNTGATEAQIQSIALSPPGNTAFSLTELPGPLPGAPLVLASGASTTFSVGFFADAVSEYAAAVEITGTFNGQPVTYVVSVEGRGALDATQVDEFDQLGQPKVDILFVIDDSCSMQEEQASLSSNFEAFIQFASAQQLDYQIGVTTTDVDEGNPPEAGRLVPVSGTMSDRIVTPLSQPSPEERFSDNAAVGIDDSAFTEKGLEAAYLALSNPLIFGHNSGFLRSDAVLSVIFVSDEEDYSPAAVDFYTNFFLSIKGFRNTNLFTASAIVGDAPAGCNGAGGSADAGARYVELANRTGGLFHSICTADWSTALEDLSTTAFGLKSRFFLSNQPVVGSLELLVSNGDGNFQAIPAQSPSGTLNWRYDFATNSINFSPLATPEPGAEVRVEYVVECL